MKIAITGHTSGIGKSLYDFYVKKHQVFGFSRNNGYDISKKSNKIVEKIQDYDIFFNNAYSGFAQTELLFKLWEKWHMRRKLIININSMMGQTSWPYKYNSFFSKYKVHKLSLEKAIKEIQQTPSKCQVSQITLGFVKTKFLPKIFANKKALHTKEVVEIADIIVSRWQKFKIHNITVGEIW